MLIFVKRPRCRELAEAFGAQVVLESPERAGSLRRAAREAGVDVLVYEGGEGLRFDEFAIKAGVDGIANVMLKCGMLELADGVEIPHPRRRAPPLFANASKWVRAPDGGIFRTHARSARRSAKARPSAGSPTPTRTRRARSARRAAASSSATRRCPSSTWATRCSTSPGPTSSTDHASPEREAIALSPVDEDEIFDYRQLRRAAASPPAGDGSVQQHHRHKPGQHDGQGTERRLSSCSRAAKL